MVQQNFANPLNNNGPTDYLNLTVASHTQHTISDPSQYLNSNIANKIGNYTQNVHTYPNQTFSSQQLLHSNVNQNQLLQMQQQYHQQNVYHHQDKSQFLQQQQHGGFQVQYQNISSQQANLQTVPMHQNLNSNFQQQCFQSQYTALSNSNAANQNSNIAAFTRNSNFLRTLNNNAPLVEYSSDLKSGK